MNIVIVGARARDTEEDKRFVHQLIKACSERYPLCTFATTLTTAGVGYFVKEKCLEQNNGKYRYQLIDVNLRLMGAMLLSPEERNAVLIKRNATLFELADVFLYLAMPDRRGMMEDLLQRVTATGRPYRVYLPGDEIDLP